MTQDNLQNLLFKIYKSIGKDEDGDFRIVLDADEDCDQPVIIYIRLTDIAMRITGVCPKFFKIDNSEIAKILRLINEWNAKKLFPKAYLTKNESAWYVTAETNLILDDEEFALSDTYVEKYIKNMGAFIWKFYVSLNKGKIDD